ncbi:MAG: methionine gamma-lyase family protein [Clostridia bacterium]|nr:methionine gamma-lyase family protein [Clostridia bacterium]
MFVKQEIIDLVNKNEKELQDKFNEIKSICEYNTEKVLKAFQNNNLSEVHFNQSTGYGYNDIGRETIEKIYSEIFTTEDALVRGQFISASHALNVTLFGLLRPNDTMISISGKPYDTLDEVIGLVENPSSLKSFGIKYEQIDLINNDFDYEKIKERLAKNNVKLVEIQRSRGYSLRKSITLDKIEKVIKTIRSVNNDAIIMIDNCYGEFTTKEEPSNLGADILVGSLIKNLGGGIAPNGAYVVGRKDLISLVAERLTLPGEGAEVGPTLGMNKMILQGLFFAPSVVANSLKTAILTAKVMEDLGYKVDPTWNEQRTDIVQTIQLDNREKLIKYVQGIQMGSPIDSNTMPIPDDMPGYTDQVIMAAGTFTQGSSIELSCDAPIRPPYVAFQQGGLTYEFGKLGLMKAIENLYK